REVGHEVDSIGVAVREQSLAHILELLAKGDCGLRRTVRREQSYGFPGSAQLKAGVQIASGAILGRVIVGPNEQETAPRNKRIRRDAPFVRLRERVGKILAGEI